MFAPGRTFPQVILPELTANGPDSLEGNGSGTLSDQRDMEFLIYFTIGSSGLSRFRPVISIDFLGNFLRNSYAIDKDHPLRV